LKEFSSLGTDTAGASADESYLAVELGHVGFLIGGGYRIQEMGIPMARAMARRPTFNFETAP
jgi:hypothetical protein